jgi:hypothetical protein
MDDRSVNNQCRDSGLPQSAAGDRRLSIAAWRRPREIIQRGELHGLAENDL